MKDEEVHFELSFYGNKAAESQIDLYDASVALAGFHRTLALTTHLILHDEIIVQAPGLRDAAIYASVAEAGSWKFLAVLAIPASAMFAAGTAPQNTPLGHLVHSVYDYVIKESLGFHVNYNESLGIQYEKYKKQNPNIPIIEEYRLDSLIEKCENSVKDIHRPISGKGSATSARIRSSTDREPLEIVGSDFTAETYDYVRQSIRSTTAEQMSGCITSYNNNTFRGRVYLPVLGFSVPFGLSTIARSSHSISVVTTSLVANSLREEGVEDKGLIYFNTFTNSSKNGRIKSLDMIDVFVDE